MYVSVVSSKKTSVYWRKWLVHVESTIHIMSNWLFYMTFWQWPYFWNVLVCCFSCWCSLWRRCCGPRELRSRTIHLGKPTVGQFPANTIRNQKYNIITFLPLVLYQQFKFFLNLYFLVMATSQFVPDIRIGYLYTYWGPLVSDF